jgi:YegS/Rv2252/BmrU family lipid kinase
MSIVAIINPVSGAGANPAVAAARMASLRAEAARRGLELDVHLTERAGHARELAAAAAARGIRLVIAWGGDGTINETGAALLHSGTCLGVVPAGSGNGLAAALGLSRDPAAAVPVAFGGRERTIDAGLMAGRPFFNIAGVGFDARVARLFNEQAAGSRGGWPYIRIGVREGCRYCATQYDLELDGRRRRLPALLVAFANGREYGMGARIAPQAELDDGVLDATIVEDRPVLARFWHARHLALGTAHLAPLVTVEQVRRAIIDADGDIEYHVDGEPGAVRGPIEVSVAPLALRVKVP